MSNAYDTYQYKPFKGSSHSWALGHLAKAKTTDKILDIGAGSGFVGKFLADKGLKELYAVEIDPPTAEKLGQTYKKVVPNVSDLAEHKFDIVVLLDILEHLPNPAEYMLELKKYLAPDATVLISVPNIAHWSVRIPLLFGFFNYRPRGILDHTHLHFFTRSSFKRFLQKTELRKMNLSQSVVPFEFVLPKFFYDNIFFDFFTRVRITSAQILPGLFAFQHLAVLKNTENSQI